MTRFILNIASSFFCYIFEGWSDGVVIGSHPTGWSGNGEWHSIKQIAYAVLHVAIFDAQVTDAGILAAGLLTISSVLLGRTIVHPIACRTRLGQTVNQYPTVDSCDINSVNWRFWLWGWDWWDAIIVLVNRDLHVPQFVFCSILTAIPAAGYLLILK